MALPDPPPRAPAVPIATGGPAPVAQPALGAPRPLPLSAAPSPRPIPIPAARAADPTKIVLRNIGPADASDDSLKQVTKNAPPWLISCLVHLMLVVVLGLWYI